MTINIILLRRYDRTVRCNSLYVESWLKFEQHNMPKSGGTNVPESTSFENPSFVHYVDMNQGGGSHSDDENDEIDIDVRQIIPPGSI